MKKQWIALFLILSLCAAGCGGPAADSSDKAAQSVSSQAVSAQETQSSTAQSAADSAAEQSIPQTETARETPVSQAEASGETGAAQSGTAATLEYDENGMPVMPVLTDTRGEEYKENTFTTLNGDQVTYNMNTRRIVCILGSQDIVAFGIRLIAYEGYTEDIEGFESFYEGAQRIKNTSPFSPEEIMAYEPELILVNQRMSQTQIEQLSKIAPTIPLYTDSTDFTTRLSYIGEIFGLQDSANLLIDYANALKDHMVAQLKELNLSDKTLTIYTYMGAVTIPPERGWFMNTIIYDYAGIGRLPIVEEFMTDESGMAYEAISAEKLKEYEGDLVIYAGFGETEPSSYVTENVGWQSLDAVKEGRVGVIDITPYAQKGVILLADQYGQVLEALKTAGNITS